MIIEEILKQRYEGIKNEKGVYVTPAFPKLIYVLDENNMKNGKYRYITDLAVKCTAKRMYPRSKALKVGVLKPIEPEKGVSFSKAC